MTDVIELINEVRQTGITLRVDPPDLVLNPAGRIPLDLKARLRDRKADVVRYLELEASLRRLEAADILLAISEDGIIRVVHGEADATRAAIERFTIYTPKDAYIFVTLSERERRMLHAFKRMFGGTTEWRNHAL